MYRADFVRAVAALLDVALAEANELNHIVWYALDLNENDEVRGPRLYRACRIARRAYNYRHEQAA